MRWKHGRARERLDPDVDLASRRAMISIDELFRGYPERLAVYTITIRNAPITPQQRLVCQQEVFRGAVYWAALRVRQVASGASPWR